MQQLSQVKSGALPMPGGSVYKDILETLEHNGENNQAHYRRLVLIAFLDIGRRLEALEEIQKKVERLERNSLILIAKKHPKASVTVLTFTIIFVVSAIARLELWVWLFELIGVPAL